MKLTLLSQRRRERKQNDAYGLSRLQYSGMKITTDESGVRIEVSERDWGMVNHYTGTYLHTWNQILAVQVSRFLSTKEPQVFRWEEHWSIERSGQVEPGAAERVHVSISSTSAIEDDLPDLTASVYSGVGNWEELSFCYFTPKGSIVPDEWLYVLIDCSKELGKILAGIAAKSIFDYYKNKRTKSKEEAHVVVLYGPNSEVYKKFTVKGDGAAAEITDEDDNFKFPEWPDDAMS